MEHAMSSSLQLVIGIATAGRREQLSLTLAQLAKQRTRPARVLVCPAGPDDYDDSASLLPGCQVEVLRGPRGLTAQRNTILAACEGADVVLFLDDDYYPAEDYVEQVTRLFERHADIVMATNHPLRDGATGPGISHEQAVALIATMPPLSEADSTVHATYGGYGCNMAIRVEPVRVHGLRFDENLPLYGWLEDIDFSRRLAPHGRVVKFKALRGVHLATKRGRASGLRLGYSQIANPTYLLRKGSMTAPYAWRHMLKNFSKNAWRALHPEPWVDRKGRLRGNLLALFDLVRGRLDPRRILDLG
jgi:GT2 family glycosyltransferase